MLKKNLLTLLYVCYVSATSKFIGDAKKRAEFFELTDNEVAVFRITLPPEEFEQLKEEGSFGMPPPPPGGMPPPPFGMPMNGTDGQMFMPPPFGMPMNGTDGQMFMPPPFGMPTNGTDGGQMMFMPPPFGMPTNGTDGDQMMFMPPPPPGFDFEGGDFIPPSMDNDDSFKTKNATMVVELNGEKKSFKKVTFSLGGSSSRTFGKQGYNLKIRNDKDLYGRSQFRIRPDAREATYLRSKLVCDIHNRLGIPSISANYIQLYINDEYMGFYIIMDSFKLSWVEFEYGEEDSTHLYQCKNMSNTLTVKNSATRCQNENEILNDNTDWVDLLTRLDAAESAEDIEDIFDVDQFLTEIAYEYLAGSWDHYLNFGHNFSLYKPKNDKWKMMLYDFDGELGQDVAMGVGPGPGGFGQRNTTMNTDFASYTFAEWTKPRHLIDILILNNSTRFDNILKNFVTEVFNPATLFPHIDELKDFIRPYVELDKIPDENGKFPGKINERAGDYTLAQWEANCEFTKVRNPQGMGSGFGLKYWILAKYRYVCKAYNIECDETYLDENYEYPIDKSVEASDDEVFMPPPPPPFIMGQTQTQTKTQTQTQTQNQYPTPPFSYYPYIPSQTEFPPPSYYSPTSTARINSFETIKPTIEPTETLVKPTETIVKPTETVVVENPNNEYQCMGELEGYNCCGPQITDVLDHNVSGDWGYDFENMEWCSLTPYKPLVDDDEECWSKDFGYPCCKGCEVHATDKNGQWGYNYAKEEWCGIRPSCNN